MSEFQALLGEATDFFKSYPPDDLQTEPLARLAAQELSTPKVISVISNILDSDT
jgi:hypothetical protein